MVKSSIKEKPEYEESAYHFKTHELPQQYFDEEINIPSDFANELLHKKNLSKVKLKVFSKDISYKSKYYIAIKRIQRYIRSPDDNVLILCVNGDDEERARFEAFTFNNNSDLERFIEKLEIHQKELDNGENAISNNYSDNVSTMNSVRTKNSVHSKLTNDDFSTYGKRKSQYGTTSYYGVDEEPKYDGMNHEDKLSLDNKSVDENRNEEHYTFEKDFDNFKITSPQAFPMVYSSNDNMFDTKKVLLTDACDMTKVRAPEFARFPETLPTNLTEDIESQKLQYNGDFKAYDDRIEFYNKVNSDLLFTTPYSEIKNVHEFPNQPTNLLIFRDDYKKQISQMVLLNFDSRSGTRSATNILKNKGVDVYQYQPSREIIIKNTSATEVKSSNDDFIRPAKSSTVQFHGRTTNFSGNDSKFDSINIRGINSRQRVEKFDKEELKQMPDEGPWDYNMIFLKEDPQKGAIPDNEGSVYMFVAHKVKN